MPFILTPSDATNWLFRYTRPIYKPISKKFYFAKGSGVVEIWAK
jgi:hypothetical protein